MENYIDGFVFPLPRKHLNQYKAVAEAVAEIWKEYGALGYFEFLGDDLNLEGTRSFAKVVELKDDEVVVFGWVVFPSKAVRDKANEKVPADPRMTDLVAPLTRDERPVFDAERMIYGGFQSLLHASNQE